MKTFAIGDIHGCYKALVQCLERSKFDYKKDRLICLGDVCDGWAYVKDCYNELLKIKNLVYILGNHDDWALEWFDREHKDNPYSRPETYWTSQGGRATLISYRVGNDYDGAFISEMPEEHLNLLRNAKLYYKLDSDIFVHGGISETRPVEELRKDFLIWDRDMLARAYGVNHYNKKFKIQKYDNIFIGHTTTQAYKTTEPIFACNVIDLDTGAGWNGKLTIMDIKSKEYWQSDLVESLYPGEKNARG